jgi:diacylglycerol kinase (ATP)
MSGDGRRVFVVFNPASNEGAGSKRIPRYLDLLGDHLPEFEHAVTTRGGEEADLAEKAIRDGFDTIVAVGGDGTLSTVADRILSLDGPNVAFGVLPGGTGNDFGRNLGISWKDAEEAVRVLARGHVRSVDVGVLRGPTVHEKRGGPPRSKRYFLNLVGFGFDVAVVDAAKGARFLRGELLYKITALQQLFRYSGFTVSVEDGEGYVVSGDCLMLTVTNGVFFGGGFPISPGASVLDGLLHSCHIGNAKPLRRLHLFDRAGKGRHEESSEVDAHAAPRFKLTFTAPVRLEMDGDVYASAEPELLVEVFPRALSVVAPPG